MSPQAGRLQYLTGRSISELHPQGQLDQAWAPHRAGGRREYAGLNSGSRGLYDLAEVGVAHVADRVGEIGVIEEIEEVGPELQTGLFAQFRPQRKILGRGEIVVL